MQILSKVPINEIRVGDRVKSSLTNREGVIVKIIDIANASRFEDNEILVKWENGNISHQWHFVYDKVWLM